MSIYAFSFDFDGCIFNSDYQKSKDVLAANDELLKWLKAVFDPLILQKKKVQLQIGSLRQSFELDQINSQINKTESAILALEKISNKLNIAIDDFLMADIFGNLKPGESYQKILKGDNKNVHETCISDTTKVTLLLAQIQKIANENPGEDIQFHFFDDRKDILKNVQAFFSQYPTLLPSTATLNLLHYSGGKSLTFYTRVEGKGEMDKDYVNTIKQLTKWATQETGREHIYNNFKIQSVDVGLVKASLDLIKNVEEGEAKREDTEKNHDTSLNGKHQEEAMEPSKQNRTGFFQTATG